MDIKKNIKRPLNLYDILKVLALVCMVIDHVGYFLFPELIWMRRVGRIAFPVFLFLVGYNHSYRRRRSLWIWWAVVQLGLRWSMTQGIWGYGGTIWINILLAIAVTRVLLWVASRHRWAVVLVYIVGAYLLWESVEVVEYGTMSLIRWCAGYGIRRLTDNLSLSTPWKYWLSACILLTSLYYQYQITYIYFAWSVESMIWNVICIWVLIGMMIWGNRAVELRWTTKDLVLWLSKYTLPLYAIHICILFLLAALLMR